VRVEESISSDAEMLYNWRKQIRDLNEGSMEGIYHVIKMPYLESIRFFFFQYMILYTVQGMFFSSGMKGIKVQTIDRLENVGAKHTYIGASHTLSSDGAAIRFSSIALS